MSESIGIGTPRFPFETAGEFFEWVELCEDGDVDSIWTSDRLISESTSLEPLALMGILAGATERLQFGMNVVVLPFRDPLILAKQCATIDYLSNGRLPPTGMVSAPLRVQVDSRRRAGYGRDGVPSRLRRLLSIHDA